MTAQKILYTANELASLGVGAVVLDSRGIARIKCYPHSGEGPVWAYGENSPITDKILADGEPMVLLYDPAHPRESLAGILGESRLLSDPLSRWDPEQFVRRHDYRRFHNSWNTYHPYRPLEE